MNGMDGGGREEETLESYSLMCHTNKSRKQAYLYKIQTKPIQGYWYIYLIHSLQEQRRVLSFEKPIKEMSHPSWKCRQRR